MMHDRQVGPQDALNGFDLGIRHRREPVPWPAQDADKAPGLAHFEEADWIHDTVEKEIAWEHGSGDEAPHSVASGPDVDLRKEQLKSLRP